MPCFDGLLPEPFNTYVLDLLFDLVTWLSYGKLRQHTDSTLDSFDATTTSLGAQLRKFTSKTCAAFQTKETPREETARARRTAAKKAKHAADTAPAGQPPSAERQSKSSSSSKTKPFNLCTYKLHALGDYVTSIRFFGTTDSYSTQIVSYPIGYFMYRSLNRVIGRVGASQGEAILCADKQEHVQPPVCKT